MKMRHQYRLGLLVVWMVIGTACNLMKNEGQVETTQPIISTATQILEPSPYPTPTEVKVQSTIRIWHSWNESERVSLVQIIAGFNELYPDVFFDVLYIPAEDIQARYVAETQEGSGPTLLLGPAEWGPSLSDAGLIVDLEGVLQDSLISSINQPALGASQYKESLVGLPYAIQGIVLYRNMDIATLAPKSLDELIMLAQTSTQGEDVGAVLERSFFYSGAHLNGIGGQWMDTNGMPAFNSEKAKAWIEILRTFEQAGPVNYLTDQDIEFFEAGRVGWIIDGTWNLQSLAESIGVEKLAIDPWPSCEYGLLSGYVLPELLYLSSRTEGSNRDAAIKFIEYFLSPQAQNNLTAVGRIPALSGIQLTETDTSALISQAMTALEGIPKVRRGTKAPVAPALLAASGPATPSMTPVPNFSGCLEDFFSTA